MPGGREDPGNTGDGLVPGSGEGLWGPDVVSCAGAGQALNFPVL